MPTRNIVLTESQDELVAELVKSGRYKSASEVMRDGLRLLADGIERHEAQLEDIRAGILEGVAEIEAGDYIDGSEEDVVETAFAEAEAEVGH